MQTTIQIKLYLTNEQKKLIKNTMQEYVVTVNRTIEDFVELNGILYFPYLYYTILLYIIQ